MTQTKYIPALRFSSLTTIYDPIVSLTSREQRMKDLLLRGANVQAGECVLDVGCGTGTLLCMLASRNPVVEIQGIDGDCDVLKQAEAKANRLGLNIGFTTAMSYNLPFADNRFDHVFSTLMFHHLGTKAKEETLTEVYRVLRPGGILHIADWGSPQDFAMRTVFWAVRLLDGIEPTRDNVQGRLPEIVRAARFKNVRVDARMRTMLGTIEMIRAEKQA